MDQDRVLEAITHFSRFERTLAERPRLRYGMFLAPSVYTWNAAAMLANSIGACELILGNLDAAEGRFEQALAADRGYPLPYFNLAVLAQARGLPERAELLLKDAVARGFRGGTREKVISMAGSVLAAVEGRA